MFKYYFTSPVPKKSVKLIINIKNKKEPVI